MADQKPFSTAAQLRARPIVVTVQGDGDAEPIRISCKRPDPLVLFANGHLPLEIYGAVVESLGNGVGDFSRGGANDPVTYGDFIDRWACAAAVKPVVVMTEAESSDEAIWVEDLAPEARVAIFMRTNDRLTNKRVIDAVAEFRRHKPVDLDPGSGGTSVRGAAVESLVGV